MATCPPLTNKQLIDMLNENRSLPAPIYKVQQVIYTLNKGVTLKNAVFPSSYTTNQIEDEYKNFVSTRLIQAMKETEFWAIYALVTQDQCMFDVNVFNYFYKKLTYDVIGVYDTLIAYHAADLHKMIDELNRYVNPIHTKVLAENMFSPVNKVWGFSAVATVYCMYIRVTENL